VTEDFLLAIAGVLKPSQPPVMALEKRVRADICIGDNNVEI